MSNLIKSSEDAFNALQQISITDLSKLLIFKMSEQEETVTKGFAKINDEQLSQKERLDKLVEKSTYFEENNFKNLTNLGMDFLPQISNQALSTVLRWLKLTKYNSSNKNYVPCQESINRDFARESMTKEINGKMRISYNYNSEKIIKLLKKKLFEKNLLTEFEKHVSSQERNDWIRQTLLV